MKLHITEDWLRRHVDEEEPGGLMACSPYLYQQFFDKEKQMSYSFQVRGTDKQSVKDSVFTKFTEVCEQQKEHALDAEAANTAVGAFIDMLTDDPAKDIFVSVSGSLSWLNDGDHNRFTGSNLNISTALVTRVTAGTAA